MRRDQLEHAIRAACQIVDAPAVVVVGSQAILASYREEDLPDEATMSMEIDILPIAEDHQEAIRLGDLIEGAAGEFSPFGDAHGFSIDAVDLSTAVLPEGWRDRLVKVQNANTAAPSGKPEFVGLCLEKHDLCAAKLCAFREKDRNFVGALLDAGLVEADELAERLSRLAAEFSDAVAQAGAWLAARSASS
jgi:hypothetical protein